MWIYNGKEVKSLEDLPEGAVGFIYKISKIEIDDVFPEGNPGKFYIGKKQLFTNRRVKITNKEKIETKNNRKKFKQLIKESDWLIYNSSCLELKKEILENKNKFIKEIIEFCFNKKELTFFEVYYQFKHNVLFTNTYNKNILNRFFSGIREPLNLKFKN